jgi:hypothetical protein
MGGVFDRATKAAFDMAAVLKTDARGSAVQLGKALENPIKGVTALAKAGTTFTDQQKEQIRTLVESNNLLAAQELILTEVESQYGGAAEAAALGSERMKLAFGQIQDALGAALSPAFQSFTEYFINEVVPPLTTFFEEDFPALLQTFKGAATGIKEAFEPVGQALKDAFDIPDDVSLLEGLLDKIATLPENDTFNALVDSFTQLAPELEKLLPPLTELALEVLPLVISLVPILTDLVELLTGAVSGVSEGFTKMEEEMELLFGTAETGLGPIESIRAAFQTVDEWAMRARNAINSMRAALVDFFRTQDNRIPGVPSLNLPPRATGGPVSARDSYLVGERGPEIFTPGAGGFITPNNRLGGGGSGPVYNITVNAGMGAGSGAQIGREIISAIKAYERSSGPVFASA